jgi:hypothetical protein
MNDSRSGRRSYLVYCFLAVLLLGGSYVLFYGLEEDNSATVAPNLTLGR